MQRWQGWQGFLQSLTEEGYGYRVVILNAQDFGVPQSRRRMFLLASRGTEPPFEIKPETHRPRAAAEILDPPGRYEARSVFGRSRALAEATIERINRGREGVGGTDDFIIVYYGTDAAGGWQPLDRPLRTLSRLLTALD